MAYTHERHCAQCQNHGLVRIRYKSGEPDDLALCDCRQGRWFRAGGPGLVEKHIRVLPTMRIAPIEAFAESDPALKQQATVKLLTNEW